MAQPILVQGERHAGRFGQEEIKSLGLLGASGGGRPWEEMLVEVPAPVKPASEVNEALPQ